MPEDRGLFRELTVKENLDLGCWGRKDAGIREDLDFIFELFPILKTRGGQQAETLSGGEQQMLAVARALARDVKLLLLDEVMAGLRPAEVDEMVSTIKGLRDQGITIFVIEHIMRAIMALSDRIVVIHFGKKISEGTQQDVASDENVIKAYLGDDYVVA